MAVAAAEGTKDHVATLNGAPMFDLQVYSIVVNFKSAFVIKGFAAGIAANPALARGCTHSAHAMHLGVKGSVSDTLSVLVLYKLVVDLVIT